MERTLISTGPCRSGSNLTGGGFPRRRAGYPEKMLAVTSTSLAPSYRPGKTPLSGADLYVMAQQYGLRRQYAHDLQPLNDPELKKPRNFFDRLIYALIAISAGTVNRPAAVPDDNAYLVAITRQPAAACGQR